MAQRPPHDVLSDCLERWEQGQGGVEEFLAQHPELRDELEPLLGLAVELWALPKVKAPDHLRQDPLWRRPRGRTPLGVRRPRAKAPLVPFPLASRRSARAADVLDECLAREKEGGRPAARAVLGRHPKLRSEVEPLLDLADDLSALRAVRAPERLRQDPLWRRSASTVPQWAAAARQDAPARPSRGVLPRLPHRAIVGSLGRLAAGLGGAALLLLAAGTVATSSAKSLPDEPLYGVKRLVEDAQLVVTPPDSRVEAHLRRAQERMKETQEMLERDRAEAVPALVDAYVKEVDAVRTELQTARTRAPEPEKVEKVITRLEANEQVLGAIAERVAEPARPAVARAVEATRPESVAPRTESIAPRTDSGAAAPESIAPPAEGASRLAPVAAPTFGAAGAASVQDQGQRSTVRQLIEATSTPAAAATPTPAQVRAPAVSPAILPSTSTSPTTSGTSSGSSGSAGSTAAPSGSPSAAPTSPPATPTKPAASPTAVFQLMPTIAPSSSSSTAPSTSGAPKPPTTSETQAAPPAPVRAAPMAPTGRPVESSERPAPERTSSAPTLAPSAGSSSRATP